jgi:iron complex outermembrane receptor protein
MESAKLGLLARIVATALASAAPWLPPIAAAQAVPPARQDAPSPNPPTDAPAPDGEGELAQVLVTARFKTESLQDAPISITAITADQIEKRGYNNVTDVSAAAPNVNLRMAGSGFGKMAFVSIRGVGQNDFKYTFEPGVAFYIDDVYFGTVFGSVFDLTDIGGVEILRGPQGTLFGKNTEGGAIRVSTKKPMGDGSGYLEAAYGTDDRQKIKGAWDMALIQEKLFLRVSGGSNRSDGYMDVLDFACANPARAGNLQPVTTRGDCKIGELGGDDAQVGRAALRFLATENLELNLAGDLTNDHGQAPANKLIAIALPPNPAGTPGVPGTQVSNALTLFSNAAAIPIFGIPLDSRFVTDSPYTTYATFTDPITGIVGLNKSSVRSSGVAGTVDWDTPWSGVHIKSITAYREYHGSFTQDTSGAPFTGNMPTNFVKHRQFSQELQVSGSVLNSALDWTAGGYFLDIDDFNSGIVDQPSSVGGRGILFLTGDPAESQSKSVFLHANYRITDAWGAELGARYSRETKSYQFYRFEPDLRGQVPAGLFPTNRGNFLAGFEPPFPQGTVRISKVDPKAVVSYRWNDEVMTYLQYSTGYKSGGFNPRPLTRTQVTTFGPETLKAWEIGFKSEWFDRRLRANVAAFRSTYRDLQLPVPTIDPGTGFPAQLTQSVGEARIEGVELEAEGRATQALTLNASVGYLRYKNLDLGGAAYNPVTNPAGPTLDTVPALTPKWKGNVGAEYGFNLGDLGTLSTRVDYTYQTRVFNDPQNQLISMQPGYGLLSARIAWDAARGGWQASISGSNLTDKAYYLTEQNLLATYDAVTGQPGRRREVLFAVRKAF